MFSAGFTLFSVFPFFLYQSPSCLYTVFHAISSNIDDVLSLNLYANVFVFGGFKAYHKDELSYSGETDKPGELCYTQMVNFPVRIPESLIPSLLDLFISSDASICSNKLSLMLLSKFPLTCLQLQKGCTVYDYSCADKNGHCDHLTDVAADAQFYEWSLVPGWN